jgi:hypothetical protein
MFHHPVIREAIANEVRRERERRFHAIARIRVARPRKEGPGDAPVSHESPAATPSLAGRLRAVAGRPRAI